MVPFLAKSQSRITGTVIGSTGKSLAGVSVSIKDSYDGSTTDSLGNFSFSTTEKGDVVLKATYTGYKLYEESILLEANSINRIITLKELVTELKAVVLSAGTFEAADKKKGTVLSALDIVTTASAQGDITGALKTLPGTQQVGETGGLFVRGGSAGETKIFIDGSLVNNFFYSSVPGIASRGRFNPFLFKGTIFSSGGYSALYGQALSSAVILESLDMPDKSSASISASIIGAGGGLQQLSKNKQFSWGATYNYTHLGLAFAVIPQKQDYYKTPVYHEADLNFRVKTKKGGILKYYGYWNKGDVALRSADIDSTSLKDAFSLGNINTYQNLNLRENLGSGYKLSAALSFSTNEDDIKSELQDNNNKKQIISAPVEYAYKNFSLLKKSWYSQARIVLEKRLNGLNALRGGAEYLASKGTSDYTLYNGASFPAHYKDNLFTSFAETDIYLTNRLAAKLGMRTEYKMDLKKWNVAPRVSLAYRLNDGSQASFAYGIFYQSPEAKYLPVPINIGFSKATHFIWQYQLLSSLTSFRAEVFYKKYNHLYKTANTTNGQGTLASNTGSGYAKGIEFFWRDKKSIKNLDYWVSYSYLDTKRNHLQFPEFLTPDFAATHTASLVMKKFFLPIKTGFNASYSFASGRPYYQINYNAAQGKNEVVDQGRTIAYNSMGFSLNYLPNLGRTDKKAFKVWVVSISNVLGQKQVYTYNYGSISGRKQEVGPPSRRFIFLGCFISFGTDRSEDAINNHL